MSEAVFENKPEEQDEKMSYMNVRVTYDEKTAIRVMAAKLGLSAAELSRRLMLLGLSTFERGA